jgi:hypothetical protein
MIIDNDVGFENYVKALTKNNIDTVGRYYCAKDDAKGVADFVP